MTNEIQKYESLLPELITNFGATSEDEVFAVTENMEGVTAKIPDVKMSKDGIFMFPGDLPVQNFRGVILHHHGNRAYWENPDATGNRPDCKSDNGYWASPDDPEKCPMPPQMRRECEKRYGQALFCDACPMNAWGSDLKGGRGKACKEGHTLFVLAIEGDMMSAVPYRMSMPPTSLGEKDAFFTDLTGKGIPYQTVITHFSLEKIAKNPKEVYSRLIMKADPRQRLPREDQLKLKELISQYSKGFAQQEDYSHVQTSSQPAANRPAAQPQPKADEEEIPF